MARKIKAKVSYSKKKKAPKAVVGAALTAGLGVAKMIGGAVQRRNAIKAENAFDKNRLKDQVSSATRELADQPIDANIVKQQQENALVLQAQTMGNAVKGDQRNVQAVATQSQDTAQKGLLDQAIEANAAKTNAMNNLATEQTRVKGQSIDVATSEIEGIKAEKDAGNQNIWSGVEDVASGSAAMGKNGAKIKAKKGANIGYEEGGVTPGKFSHEENPIDMVQDGEKIGEATGGELILPPDDVEAVRSALDEGDKDAAFKLMEELVAKYDKNVIEAEDTEGGATQGEGTPPMMSKGGYLEKVKARMGAYMKSKY